MTVHSLNSIEVGGKTFNSLSLAIQAAGPKAQELENLILTYEGEILQKAVAGEEATRQHRLSRKTEKEREVAELEIRLRRALSELESE